MVLYSFQVTGAADFSRDVTVRDDLTVYDDANLRGMSVILGMEMMLLALDIHYS
jgi:hypothetical protein